MLKAARIRRLFKEGSWIVFGQVLMAIGSLIGVRILTELLTPKAYGELALGMTLAILINQIIFGPLGGGVIRFYAPAVEYGDLASYLSAVKKMVWMATGIILLVAILSTAGLIIAGYAQWVAITVSAFLFATLSGYNANLSGIQSAARQRFIVAIHQGVDPWLRFLVSGGLLIWVGASSTVAMMGYVIATLMVLGSQLLFYFKVIVTQATTSRRANDWQDEIWRFSWPIGIFGIFTWIQLVSDRWSLQLFSSLEDVGKYAVLYQLGVYPVSLVSGMAMQFLLPIVYQRAGNASNEIRNKDAKKLIWNLTWMTIGVTVLVFLSVVVLHGLIFKLLVAQQYRSVSYLLPWMILAGGIFAAGQTLALNLQAQIKTREMMPAKIVSALFGVVFNFIGAYWYGITGVVCAGVIFSALYFLWIMVLVDKVK